MRALLLAVLLAATPLTTPLARAASPEVGLVFPRGGTRGTSFAVTFYGNRLKDATGVLFYGKGITVAKIQPAANSRSVRALFTVAKDCPLGEHHLRLVTATGISELRSFWVGSMPILGEKEPNNDARTAQPIPLGRTIRGRLTNEDVDRFAITARKGQRITVELEGIRLGSAFYDPHLSIVDSRRFELAASDDTPRLGPDPSISVVVPADGVYQVVVREAAYRGNGNCWYRLHVGSFPRPQMLYPAGGQPGKPHAVTLLGDPGGPQQTTITPPPGVPGLRHPVWHRDAHGTAASSVAFMRSSRPNTLEAEPNDNRQQSKPWPDGHAVNGVIGKPGDSDWWRVTLKRNQTIDLLLTARSIGSPLDGFMSVHRADGRYLAGNDDGNVFGNRLDSRLRYRAPADGTYHIRVADQRGRGGPTFVYRIEPLFSRPAAYALIPPVGRNSQALQNAPVPQGNRYVALIQTVRIAQNDVLRWNVAGLPKGVTVTIPPVPRGMAFVPALFEAAADAPLGGALTRWTAQRCKPDGAPSGAPVDSTFAQFVPLLVGPPNQSLYHRVIAEAMPVAATKRTPFRIELVQPKAPLVRDGSSRLIVKVTRDKGYRGRVVLQMLYHPPGVSSRRNTVVPPNANQAVLTLTANGRAAVGRFPIAIRAYAGVGDGAIWVGSNLATLEVAPPMVTVALNRSAVEQGKTAQITGTLTVVKPFAGNATVRLLGLPRGLQAKPVIVTGAKAGAKTPLSFTVAVPANLRPSRYRGLFCQVQLMVGGELALHRRAGRSELRVDRPRPAPSGKKAAPKPRPKPATKPAVKAPPRPLTRLEKLRLEQQRREQANQQDTPKPKTPKPAAKQ